MTILHQFRDRAARKPETRRQRPAQSRQGVQNLRTGRPEKRVSQEAPHRSGLQLPQDTVQFGHKQGQRLEDVASYALYSLLCLVLNREAAENINRPDKAVSPTYFNT